MNIDKISRDILSKILSQKKKGFITPDNMLVATMYNNKVCIANNTMILLIEKEDFYFNMDIFKEGLFSESYKSVFTSFNDAKKVEVQYYIKDEVNGKTVDIARLEDKDKTILTYLDSSNLKYFNFPTFKTIGGCNPIFVFEDEKIVGVLVPIKHKEQEM